MDRERALARLKSLVRRAGSPNPHEAKNAQRRAEELSAKSGIPLEEVRQAIKEDEAPSWRRGARPVDADASWRAHLACSIASQHGATALRGTDDRLHFDGGRAGEASAAFRRTANEIEGRCTRAFESQGIAPRHKEMLSAIFSSIYCAEAARAIADRRPRATRLDSHRVPREAAEYVKTYKLGASIPHLSESALEEGRACGLEIAGGAAPAGDGRPQLEPDHFLLRPGLLVVASRRPGSYATLFVARDGHRLTFRRDASSFDDESRRYAWAFERDTATAGAVVFATDDRTVVGEVEGESVRTTGLEARVARTIEGEPTHLERILPA